MDYKKRTHTCGELRAEHIGKTVTLNGWIATRRDLGGVIFVDVRDRHGITQVVFNPQHNAKVHESASALRNEFVISVTGRVEHRPEGTTNAELTTGMIDVFANELTILNKADTPPFPIEDEIEVSEDIRLKYRYLDLRRHALQKNLIMRHKMYLITRKYFDEKGFVEVETPILMKSTPEGARDYLVPSRVHRGEFYALPQSPQTYKQILMVAGMDRYFQIVKCFRDEDLRADRQPEFTQIDVEMSFIAEDDIMEMAEGLMIKFFREIKGLELKLPLPRMTYKEAMETYGSDKPDTRFDMSIVTINETVKDSAFKVFGDQVKKGGVVAGIVAKGCGEYTRNQLDLLTDFTKKLGAGGLIWIRVTESGAEAPIEKFVGKDGLNAIAKAMDAKPGDLLLVVADSWSKAYNILGSLRLEMARRLNLIDETKF
ncbi:MAG TPA: aspartate--tRNA ligase, partial [Bacteroidota bacterium]|nr:aspartate--tRNA ligase [Bacteroidota bacterium]